MWTGAYTTPITTGIPVVTTTALAAGNVGVPYSWQLTATGTNGAVKWTVTGTLPAGLTLSKSGLLSGTPTTAGTASGLVFIVTDSLNQSDSATLSLQVNATTGAPDPPSAMWPGPTTSNRTQISWWPAATIGNVTQNNPVDTNTYNVYRVDAGTTPIATGILPTTRSGLSLKSYWFCDTTLAKSTTYQYYVRAVSSGGVLSAPGPTLTVTTLAGPDTPPTPPVQVADPATWIQPFALPTGNVWIVDVTTAAGWNTPGTASSGTATNNVHCGFQYALNNCNRAGGDILVLTAGLIFPTPASNFQAPAFTGVNGWTYIISSEDPVYKAGGILPAYEFNTNTLPFKLTLTGTLVVGAVNAQLTTPWTRKTGLYPVHFSSAEERYVKFTNGQTLISWNTLNGIGTPQNPYGWDGNSVTVGPALAQAAAATISVNYLPGVTLADTPAMPVIHFGGPATNGGGVQIALGTNPGGPKLRFVGIWFKPVPGVTSQNFSGLSVGTSLTGPGSYDSIYTDRCMFGCDTTTFHTTGAHAFTPIDTDYGNVIHGIDALYCDHQLAHGCYFQCAQAMTGLGQDSQGLFSRGGGPLCIQNCYIEAVAEGFIAGGAFTPQNNNPHDLTYRYNYNCKPLWWAWGPSQTLLLFPCHITNTTGSFSTVSPETITVGELITISGTPTGTGSIAGYVNPTTYKVSAWNFNTGVLTLTTQADVPLVTVAGTTTGLAFTLPSGADIGTGFYFGDYVKNNWELKCMVRANVYGNTHQNSYNDAGSPGQKGVSFGIGARDQVSAGTATIFQTAPWSVIIDIDVHDNVAYQVGQGFVTFGGVDTCPATYTQRVRFHNNQFLTMCVQSNAPNGATASPPDPRYLHASSGSPLYTYQDNGIIADIIIDHNTFVTDWLYGYYHAGGTGYAEEKGLFPVGSTAQPYNYDRHVITNNVWTGKIKGDGLAGDATDPYLTDEKWTNLTWANNLLQTDYDSPLPAGVVYRPAVNTSIPFANMGFANFVDTRHQPLQPSDWNIVSGTYATADQTGGPVGATFAVPGAFDPVGLFLGNSLQGISLQIPGPSGTGSGQQWIAYSGTDAKYGNVLPRTASPWGGTAAQPEQVQQIYGSGSTGQTNIVESIATDDTVPTGVSNSVAVETLVNAFSGAMQDSYLIEPNISLPQGMLYTSRWCWLQADLVSRGNTNQEVCETKTPDGSASPPVLGPARFQVVIESLNSGPYGSPQTPAFSFQHNTQINNTGSLFVYLSSWITPDTRPNFGFTQAITYSPVPVPLGRWFRFEWAFNKLDSSNQGWMWCAITDPGSTDANLRAGVQVYAWRGAATFTDTFGGTGTFTNGLNPGPAQGGSAAAAPFWNRIFLNNLSYGPLTRSAGSPYVVKWTDMQVYARWPSTATAHPANYL